MVILTSVRRGHPVAQSFALACVLCVGATFIFKCITSRLSADDPTFASFFPGGAFHSSPPTTFEEEVAKTAALLKLTPGMTYCELGAANGLWAAALAAKALPGGRIVATVGTEEEKPLLLAAAASAGIPASVERGTDTVSGFPQDESCDVIMSRMSFFFVNQPQLYAAQLYKALKPGGLMFISDHGSMTGPLYSGERGFASRGKMTLITERTDFESVGFVHVASYDWTHFFFMGFANLFTK